MKSSAIGPFRGPKNAVLHLRKTIALMLVVRLLVIVGGNDRPEDEPIYLTTMSRHHFVLPFIQMDQCMPLPGKPVMDSFGLHFRLPNGFLCPKPGLIICYRSQLDPSRTTNGLAAGKQYQVRNHPAKMDIVEKCRQQYPGERDIFHGIRISTNEKEKKIILELSITDHIFILPLVDYFWINFGRENSLSSFVRLPDNEVGRIRIVRRFARDNIQYNGFMDNIGHGATMQQFAGLWLLTMDILPMEFVKELHLFVFRDCNCTMESWFTHPIYVVDPERLPSVNYGSNECQINNTVVKTTKNIGAMKKGDIITIWFSPIADTKSVEIAMEENGMSISLTILDENIHYHDLNWDYSVLPSRLPSEHRLLLPYSNIRIEIHIHEYSFELVYVQDDNEQMVGNNNFWLFGREELKNVTVFVRTNAFMGRIEKSEIEHQDWELPKMPYSMRLAQDVTSGSTIRIHGMVEPNAEYIEINLMHDAPEWQDYIGATCLQINVTFDGTDSTLVMNTYHNGKWFEPSNKIFGMFKQGQMFDLIIVMERFKNETHPTLYKMTVNGHQMEYHGDLPIWTINWISLKGAIKLLTLPIENYKEDQNPTYILEKHELEHLFMEGEELCISANSIELKGQKSSFQIYLFHEANEENKYIGDMLLKIEFTFPDDPEDEGGTLIITSKLHHLNQSELYKQKNPLGTAGQDFSVVIKAERNQASGQNQYKIKIRSGDAIIYPSNKQKDLMPPSWTVNWLIISGNLRNLKIGKETGKCEGEGQKPLPPNIKQVDPKKPLAIGNMITIQGKIKKNDGVSLFISIGFFREAVEFHEIIGQTVMMANFTSDNAKFGTFYNKTWKGETPYPLLYPLVEGSEFVMVVEVMNEHYKIQVGKNEIKYSHKPMPYWAIQYIVVNNGLEANNNSPFIQIE